MTKKKLVVVELRPVAEKLKIGMKQFKIRGRRETIQTVPVG